MTEVNSADRAEKRRSQRLERVLDEAERLVAAEGMDALTLGRLARELDLVPAALYRYFSSKDALVTALQRRMVSALHRRFVAEVLEQAPAASSAADAALGRVLEAGRFYLALPEVEPETYRVLSHMLGDPRALVDDDEALSVAPALIDFLSDVSGLIRRAEELGALHRGESAARALVLWGALQGVCQLGKLARFDPERFDVRALGEDALAALLVGWGADAKRLCLLQEPKQSRKSPC